MWSHALWDVNNHFVSSNSQLSCPHENVLLHGLTNSFSCHHVFSCVANRDVDYATCCYVVAQFVL